jgi:hypothetical protein
MKTQKTKKFHMVETQNTVAFDEEINEYLDKGWKLLGAPKVHSFQHGEFEEIKTLYTQAMLMTKSSMIEE